jgi:hypothetical protein
MIYLLIAGVIGLVVFGSLYSFFDKLLDGIKDSNLRGFLKGLIFFTLLPIPFIFLAFVYIVGHGHFNKEN